MKMKKIFPLVILLMLTTLHASAQVSVENRIDSVQILIGEQAHITLSVTMKEGQHAVFPQYGPNAFLTQGVEVLEAKDGDTVRLDNQMMRVARVYTITSFDDTLYYLPPMKVKVDDKEYQGKSLALKVITLDVDTLHPNQFFPPKDVQDNPFLWSDWSLSFWLSLLMLLLLLALFYCYLRLRDNKPIISRIRFVRKLLPHQRAMKEIEQIKAGRLSQSEDQKTYYTRLTDTLRTYLEERFGFNAMEMTSSEIIERLQQQDDPKAIDELRELLQTADLVKFAKFSVLTNENDRNLASVIDFIDSTKREDMPTIEKIEPALSETDKRTQRSRKLLIALISILGAAIVAILVYVIWQAYLLIG